VSIKEVLKAGNWFNRLRRWRSDVIVWFGQLRILGIAVFGPTNLLAMVAAGVMFWLVLSDPKSCLERAIRLTGLVFQLCGVFTVVLKLRAAQHQFQLPTTNIWQWLKQFPRFPSQHVALNARGGSYGGPLFSAARLRVSPGPGSPLDQRVTLLEQQYASLFDEVGGLVRDTKESAEKFSEALRVERAERETADKKHEERLQEAVVGHVHLDYAGVAYFVLGTIAGTASSDIARWLGAASCSD